MVAGGQQRQQPVEMRILSTIPTKRDALAGTSRDNGRTLTDLSLIKKNCGYFAATSAWLSKSLGLQLRQILGLFLLNTSGFNRSG